MSDILFYLNFIDNEEADRILKFFNQSVKADNLEMKKMLIRNKLKPKIKSKISLDDKFFECISKHKIDILSNLTEKQFLICINKLTNLSDYEKIANCMLFFPEVVKKYKDRILENKTNGKDIFDLNISFSSKDEIKEYISKTSWLSDEKRLFRAIDFFIKLAIDQKIIAMNTEDIKKFDNLSFIDFYNKSTCSEVYAIEQYLYIKKNKEDCTDIYNEFIIDILLNLLLKFSNKINNNLDEKTSVIGNDVLELSEDIKNANLKIKEIEKENRKIKKENSNLSKKIESNVLDLGEKNNEIKKRESEIHKIKEDIDKLSLELEMLKIKFKKESDVRKTYEEKLNSIEDYYKYYLEDDCEGNQPILAVIHSIKAEISKKIFKEVLFVNSKEWQGKINNITHVYIQREGISNRELIKIKKFCEENEIKNTIFSIKNEKDLIEKISLFKYK